MRRLSVSVLLTVGLLGAGSAGAEIVYNGGAPNQGNVFFADTNYRYQIAATKATLETPLTFNDMHWWGAYVPWMVTNNNPAAPASGDAFTLTIYDGSGSTPGALFHSVFLGSGNATDTGKKIISTYTEYAYSSVFSAITLGAGTYFFGLSNAWNNQDGITEWGWETTAIGNGGASYGCDTQDCTPLTWHPRSEEHLAFNLTSSGVPEPATFLLVGTAILGLGLARRRKL